MGITVCRFGASAASSGVGAKAREREAAVGRVITASSIRGKGLGRPLMKEAMTRVHQTYGSTAIKLSAQAHLAPYYRSLGFEVCGEGYDEDGIPHLPMLCEAPEV